jgi:hypothetical protein
MRARHRQRCRFEGAVIHRARPSSLECCRVALGHPGVDLLVQLLVAWVWLLITIFADLFRDHEQSGWANELAKLADLRERGSI